MPVVSTLLQGREKARALGDGHLVAEFERELERIGWLPVPVFGSVDDEDNPRAHRYEDVVSAPLEQAVVRRGPGRPRKMV